MSEYTTREATVLAQEENAVTIRMDKEDADCGGCGSCAVKSLCRGRDTGHVDLTVPVPAGRRYEPGARVRVNYRATNAAVAAAIMFVPALLGVVFGGYVARAFFGDEDSVFLFGALGGLLVGLAVTSLAARLTSLKPDVHLQDGEIAV